MTRRKGRSGRRGFALITVIWGLSIIALLIVSFMTTARLRLQTAYNLAGATRAGLIADAALGATFMALLAEREVPVTFAHQPPHDGAPKFCAIDDAAVSVSLEEETGKIDLNGATPNFWGRCSSVSVSTRPRPTGWPPPSSPSARRRRARRRRNRTMATNPFHQNTDYIKACWSSIRWGR